MSASSFPDLPALARHLRDELQTKKFILLYAYNGTGKMQENKDHFGRVLRQFISGHPFSPALFPK